MRDHRRVHRHRRSRLWRRSLAARAARRAVGATPVKHTSLKACNKQADAKKLTGPARAQFVKELPRARKSLPR